MSRAGHVFAKEAREMLRDRRTVTSALVGPVFIIVLVLFLFGFLIKTVGEKKSQTLHVVGTATGKQFGASLEKSFKVVYVPSVAEGEALLRSGKAKAVLEVPESYSEQLNLGKPLKFKVTFDPDDQKAPIVVAALSDFVRKASKSGLEAILEARGVSKELAEPVQLEKKELKKEKGLAGSMIVGLLPYLIVIWAFYGGMAAASDTVAGEKERNTLETLLISPVSRTQIALGKFWGLFALCLTSSLSSLISVIVIGSLNLSMTKTLFPHGMTVAPLALMGILATLIPLVMFFAAILLAVSAYARNSREAQTYLTLVSLLVLMPAMFSQFIGYTDFAKEWWINLVPILNSAGVIRESLLGNFDASGMGLTLLANVVLGLVALFVTIRLFNREEVLARI